jgi:hypothetical protein
MLGGRLRRPFSSKKDDVGDDEVSKGAEPEGTNEDPKPSAAKGGTSKEVKSSTEGVTLRIPSWFLRGLGGLAILAVIGFGVWYFAVRDTGPSEAEKRAEAARKQQALNAAARAQCQSQTGGLISAEEDLEGRLSGAGLTEADYLSHVGDVSAAYQQTPTKQMQLDCLTDVGVPAESAMNAYVSAANTWNNCISDFSCSQDSIDPQLQAQWSKASSQLNDAKSGLNRVVATP